MTQPELMGERLVEQIAGTAVDDDHLALWWLGQSGFVLRWGNQTLVLDPFLSDTAEFPGELQPSRLCAAPLAASDMSWCDLLLLSSGLPSHFDRAAVEGIVQANPEVVVVAPADLAPRVPARMDRVVAIQDGLMYDRHGFEIHAFGAASVEQGVGDCLGYVLRSNGLVVAFIGHGMPYLSFEERLAAHAPQVLLAPINGRTAQRQAMGLPGSLTIAEAARLAARAGADVLVPHHYRMFEFDTGDPVALDAHVAQHHRGLRVEVLEPAVRWLFPANSD